MTQRIVTQPRPDAIAPTNVQVGPPTGGRDAIRPPRRRHAVPAWVLKVTLAVTGMIWALFVAVHLFGNLKVFQGPEAFDAYAAWLRVVLYPLMPHEGVLWALRVVLLVALILHVACAAAVWARGRKARGGHRARIHGWRSWATWSMPLTGLVILAFVVVHVLDLTLGLGVASSSYRPAVDGQPQAYANLVASFQRPAMALFDVAAMVLLALHIGTGCFTMASDLGAMGRRLRATFAAVGGLLAVAILLGNSAIPILVLVGVLS